MQSTRDYADLLDLARRYAIKRGYIVDADDFASYACLRALEKDGKVNLQWALVDYLRGQYGDNRTKTSQRTSTVYLDEPLGGSALTLCDLLAAPQPEAPLPALCYRSQREVFIAERLVEGFRQREIGQMLGVSDSRISQIVRRLARRSADLDLVVSMIPPDARRWVASIYALNRKLSGRKPKHEIFNDYARSLAGGKNPVY